MKKAKLVGELNADLAEQLAVAQKEIGRLKSHFINIAKTAKTYGKG